TRPEGLGGSRDAGPATAGPRPPYVTEAVRGGYGTATPYSGYGRTGRTGPGFSFLFLPSFPFFVFRPAYAVGSTRPEGLGGSRDAGPATAGPRPPYVTEAVRHSGYTRRLRHGYAVQRLRPYGPYGPYEGRNVG
ncbi:hypothetical protein L249_6949, partial [Ophiocordyceps polyrhachis-furcata BCC 54312]